MAKGADDKQGMSVGWFLRVLLAAGACWLLAGSDCLAAGRRKVVERTDLPPLAFRPAAAAPDLLSAPILSGLDYTAVAPPGTRLRVIEDEPYVYVFDATGARRLSGPAGASFIQLRGSQVSGGEYQANINLRYIPGKSSENVLKLAFDTAAHYTYLHTMAVDEQRGELAYALNEIRAPLGLTDPRDMDNQGCEYLAYSAAVVNPLSARLLAGQFFSDPPAAAAGELAPVEQLANQLGAAKGDGVQSEEPADDAAQLTPYLSVTGQLKTLRRLRGGYCLLTVDFSAQDFSHSLTLTENIARCVINRLVAMDGNSSGLAYLAYYPEFEPFIAYFDGEVPDSAVADLAERPGEGCGAPLRPITGDVCPQCGGHGSAPAEPYSAAANAYATQYPAVAICSHCLFGGFPAADAVGGIPCAGSWPCTGSQSCCESGQRKCGPTRGHCHPAGTCRGRGTCGRCE